MANIGGRWLGDGGKDPKTKKAIPAGLGAIEDLNASDTEGAAIERDTHSNSILTCDHVGNVPYCREETKSSDFEIVFEVPDPRGALYSTIATFTWGYSWSNHSYELRPNVAAGFPPSVQVCASPSQKGGLGTKMSTGYGKGVDFSRLKYS